MENGNGQANQDVSPGNSSTMETSSKSVHEGKGSGDANFGAPSIPVKSKRQGDSVKGKEKAKKPATYFIAIHLGAGKHSMKPKSQDQYKKLCQVACLKALAILEQGGSADDAVIAATTVLEDSELVNAGTGSELNYAKKVECDAGYMSGSGYFGGVGAVPGVPNPILLARKIAQLNLTRESLIPGAVAPIILTGISAKEWAESQGIRVCDDKDLISARALRTHERIMGMVTDIKNGRKRRYSDTQADSEEGDTRVINDTVGAIALDSSGHVAASVSTGGNQIKLPGRVGHVPLFGCGCWADDRGICEGSRSRLGAPAVAVSTTGVGEMLMKMQWASECAGCLQSEEHDTPIEAMKHAIQKKFLESPLLRLHSEPKLIGGLALLWNGRRGELVYGFHAQTFVFAYAGNKFTTPQVQILTADSRSEVNVGGLDF